jgi:hypothetical protein
MLQLLRQNQFELQFRLGHFLQILDSFLRVFYLELVNEGYIKPGRAEYILEPFHLVTTFANFSTSNSSASNV